jgi:PhnB protein
MQQFIPYLGFNGNCKEAMQFYERLLGGRIKAMMSFADTPMGADMPKGSAQPIMHACLVLPDDSHLYAGDSPEHIPYQGQIGVAITMAYDSVAEAERVFKGLSEGGHVTMPLAPTFWAKMFGMVTDRYGTCWAINGEQLPVDKVA